MRVFIRASLFRGHSGLDPESRSEAQARMNTSEAMAQRNTTQKAAQDSGSEAGMTGRGARTDCRTAAQLARKRTLGGECEDEHRRGGSAMQYPAKGCPGSRLGGRDDGKRCSHGLPNRRPIGAQANDKKKRKGGSAESAAGVGGDSRDVACSVSNNAKRHEPPPDWRVSE